jgi:hypothetical protein
VAILTVGSTTVAWVGATVGAVVAVGSGIAVGAVVAVGSGAAVAAGAQAARSMDNSTSALNTHTGLKKCKFLRFLFILSFLPCIR